jgi:hypothetical protein
LLNIYKKFYYIILNIRYIKLKDIVISKLGIGCPGTVRQRTAGTKGAHGSERAWRQGRRNGPTRWLVEFDGIELSSHPSQNPSYGYIGRLEVPLESPGLIYIRNLLVIKIYYLPSYLSIPVIKQHHT